MAACFFSVFTAVVFVKTLKSLRVSCVTGVILSVLFMSQEELAASVAEQQAAVMAAGLLEAKKDSVSDDSVIGPSMPEPEPVHTEVLNACAVLKCRSED